MKILVCRFSSIGDIVLTTPILRCFATQKNAEVHFLTKKKYACIIKNNPHVSKLFLFEDNFFTLIKLLQQEKYDYVIDLHKNIRTFFIKLLLRAKSFSYHKANIEKFLYVYFKLDKLPKEHLVERYFNSISCLGVKNDNKGLDYFIGNSFVDIVQNFGIKKGYVAICIGGQHRTKKLPHEKIVTLCLSLKNKKIILLGGEEDSVTGQYVQQKTGVINACGLLSLNESASVIKQADYIITHDTGLMHIAAAFNKKIISVWGNTTPSFGMPPYYAHKESFIVENKNLSCRPCSKIGFNSCPQKHFKCMQEINVNNIADLIK